MKAIRLKMHHFHTKLPYQKQMLRQIEWWVQNGLITKNGVLPATTLFFWKFCFSSRTSYKELICCTNNSMPVFILFVSSGVLFDGAFSLCVSLSVTAKIIFCNYPNCIYQLKINNRNTWTRCKIFSRLTVKTPERRH